jgi:hypothetical protein
LLALTLALTEEDLDAPAASVRLQEAGDIHGRIGAEEDPERDMPLLPSDDDDAQQTSPARCAQSVL